MGTLRLTGGTLRSRSVRTPSGRAVRPTPARVKEALFSILADRVDDANVLDLFAGTGALGFEALSRGAAHATFVEQHRPTADALRGTARALGLADRTTVLALSAERAARIVEGRYDLVFADPPYAQAYPAAAFATLARTRRDRRTLARRLRAQFAHARLRPIRRSACSATAALRRGRARVSEPGARMNGNGSTARRARSIRDRSIRSRSGHLDVIERAAAVFPRVLVAVVVNPQKREPLFTLEERKADDRRASTKHLGNVDVADFRGLLADFAKRAGAGVIVKGLRVVSDFENEMSTALMNRSLERHRHDVPAERSEVFRSSRRAWSRKCSSSAARSTSTFPTSSLHLMRAKRATLRPTEPTEEKHPS